MNQVWSLTADVASGIGFFWVLSRLTFYRKKLKLAYTPIYFNVFPLYALNPDLAEYMGDWMRQDHRVAPDSIEPIVRARSSLSFLLDAFVIPFFFGLILGATEGRRVVAIFVGLFVAIRVREIYKTLSTLPKYSITHKVISNELKFRVMIATYIVFLASAVLTTYFVSNWCRPLIASGSYSTLADSFKSDVLIKGLFPTLVLSVGWSFVVSPFFDKTAPSPFSKARDGREEDVDGI